MIKRYMGIFHRWLLQHRINMLRADIFVMIERRDNARITIESVDSHITRAQQKLHRLQARLISSESPRTLLEEALK